jgi:quercetin dioxygenase-like cupin family protein
MKRITSAAVVVSAVVSMAAYGNRTSLAQATAPAAPARESGAALRITRAGSLPSGRGPAEYFTGAVRVDRLFDATAPSRMSGGSVTFEPGARSAWHTHPVGQVLIVTAGMGWVQREGGPVEEIRPGDVVRIPPGLRHWHGATPTTGMTHIALQEHADGQAVEWMEKVTDAQYRR